MFSITEVYPPRLKTDEKREHLTLASVDAYNEAVAESGILSPKGPVYLIDIHRLTLGRHLMQCFASCLHTVPRAHKQSGIGCVGLLPEVLSKVLTFQRLEVPLTALSSVQAVDLLAH